MKRIFLAAAVLIVFCGCNIEYDEKMAEEFSRNTAYSAQTTESPGDFISEDTEQTVPAVTTQHIAIDEVIPQAVQTPKVDGSRLLYTIINIYSQGEYYTIEISGIKLDGAQHDIETTYIKGELYGDFRLELIKNGKVLDSYKINVPRDDRVLILESVADGLTYGCELLSNKRQYNSDIFPDLIQLDFYIINEVETPQYARYFAIYDEKINEIPVYQNGVEIAPHGTHIVPESEGVMVQHVVESDAAGNYYVQMYRFTFDNDNRCLNRKRVYY